MAKRSRKHAIDSNAGTGYMSIFGGKLTDCLNVGNQVVALVKGFELILPHAKYKCYGEPDQAINQEFLYRAELMGFD